MTHPPARVDTVIVGAGQAGLTMSWHLRRAGRDHVLLDRRVTLGGGWQDRWDRFRLVSPNWTASFPGAPYDGADPDGYMPRDEIAGRVAGYAATIDAPVVLETAVERMRATRRRLRARHEPAVPSVAREVIVATGGFHVPRIPEVAAALPAEGASACTRLPTGGRPTCRPGRSSWSGRVRPACSSSKSCARPGARCISASAPRAACHAATEGATSSSGCPSLPNAGRPSGTPLPNVTNAARSAATPGRQPASVRSRRRSRHGPAPDRQVRYDAPRPSDGYRRRARSPCPRPSGQPGIRRRLLRGTVPQADRCVHRGVRDGLPGGRADRRGRLRAAGHRGARTGEGGDLDRPVDDRLSTGPRLDRARGSRTTWASPDRSGA